MNKITKKQEQQLKDFAIFCEFQIQENRGLACNSDGRWYDTNLFPPNIFSKDWVKRDNEKRLEAHGIALGIMWRECNFLN